MRPFEHLPENEVQKQRQASLPSELPAQQEQEQEQERPCEGSPLSKNTDVWMRWEYRPEEWALFERVDWRPINLRFWLLTCLSLLFLPIIGMLIWSSSSGKYPLLALSIVLLIAWTPILMMFAVAKVCVEMFQASLLAGPSPDK